MKKTIYTTLLFLLFASFEFVYGQKITPVDDLKKDEDVDCIFMDSDKNVIQVNKFETILKQKLTKLTIAKWKINGSDKSLKNLSKELERFKSPRLLKSFNKGNELYIVIQDYIKKKKKLEFYLMKLDLQAFEVQECKLINEVEQNNPHIMKANFLLLSKDTSKILIYHNGSSISKKEAKRLLYSGKPVPQASGIISSFNLNGNSILKNISIRRTLNKSKILITNEGKIVFYSTPNDYMKSSQVVFSNKTELNNYHDSLDKKQLDKHTLFRVSKDKTDSVIFNGGQWEIHLKEGMENRIQLSRVKCVDNYSVDFEQIILDTKKWAIIDNWNKSYEKLNNDDFIEQSDYPKYSYRLIPSFHSFNGNLLLSALPVLTNKEVVSVVGDNGNFTSVWYINRSEQVHIGQIGDKQIDFSVIPINTYDSVAYDVSAQILPYENQKGNISVFTINSKPIQKLSLSLISKNDSKHIFNLGEKTYFFIPLQLYYLDATSSIIRHGNKLSLIQQE